MPPVQFRRVTLRTTDVAAARAFYLSVLGRDDVLVEPLPAAAAARGAPPHWLGHLGVDDVERTAAAFTARGALRLGPMRVAPDGRAVALLRDPAGAVVALEARDGVARDPGLVWHELYTTRLGDAVASYTAVCGWHVGPPIATASLAAYRAFAWEPGGASVGAFADSTGLVEIHPQWLFHFPVASLDAAVAAVRDGGGLVAATAATDTGTRVAVCDDPLGAAFALRESGASR